MLEEHYPFVAQPLPYEYDALLPVLDEETLHFHHDKHYQTYVDKLNATLADYPQLQQMSLTELLTSEDNILASLPEEARKSIHNNGGGVYNHQLYFDSMPKPGRTGALWSSGGGAGPGFWIGETMERTDVTGQPRGYLAPDGHGL